MDGGGSSSYTNPSYNIGSEGGTGGGNSGGNGIIKYNPTYSSRWPVGAGGTQTAGGKGVDPKTGEVFDSKDYYTQYIVPYGDYLFGSFGKGGDMGYSGGAGGGGWYGGGSGPTYNTGCPGGRRFRIYWRSIRWKHGKWSAIRKRKGNNYLYGLN